MRELVNVVELGFLARFSVGRHMLKRKERLRFISRLADDGLTFFDSMLYFRSN